MVLWGFSHVFYDWGVLAEWVQASMGFCRAGTGSASSHRQTARCAHEHLHFAGAPHLLIHGSLVPINPWKEALWVTESRWCGDILKICTSSCLGKTRIQGQWMERWRVMVSWTTHEWSWAYLLISGDTSLITCTPNLFIGVNQLPCKPSQLLRFCPVQSFVFLKTSCLFFIAFYEVSSYAAMRECLRVGQGLGDIVMNA